MNSLGSFQFREAAPSDLGGRSSPLGEQSIISQCEAIIELIPAYAMGVTDANETAFVEENLAGCADAQTLLAEQRELVSAMHDALFDTPLRAPIGLREQLAAALAERAQATAVAPTTHVLAPSSEAAATGEMPRIHAPVTLPAPTNITPFPPTQIRPDAPSRGGMGRWGWIAAAAATLLLVFTNFSWWTQNNVITQERDQLAFQLNDEYGDVIQLANNPSLRNLSLRGEGEGAIQVLFNPDDVSGLLYTHDLPSIAADETYQLWFIRGTEAVSAGTFEIDEQGRGILFFRISETLRDFELTGITIEPDGGSTAPTMEPLIGGALT